MMNHAIQSNVPVLDMDELMAYDRLMLDEYKQTEEEITEAGIALEAEMAELDELKEDVFRQQDRVSELMPS